MDEWIDEHNNRRPSHLSNHPKIHSSAAAFSGYTHFFCPHLGCSEEA